MIKWNQRKKKKVRWKKMVTNAKRKENLKQLEGNWLEKRSAVKYTTEVKDVGISYIWLEGIC